MATQRVHYHANEIKTDQIISLTKVRHEEVIDSPSKTWFPGSTLKAKGSPYSITERRVPELIPVIGS